MADLIDRQALLTSMCNTCDGWCENTNCDCANCKSDHRCDLVCELSDAPAVDAVEVVRCKDCVNGTLCINLNGAEYVDCVLDDYSIRKPDGFCSYGERRSEE